jgi:hypothetical protein
VPAVETVGKRRHQSELPVPASSTSDAPIPLLSSPFDVLDYQRDVIERTILYFGTLRRRANNMLEHERAGLPPVLNFKFEMLLDARQFEAQERQLIAQISAFWETARKVRDAAQERMFKEIFNNRGDGSSMGQSRKQLTDPLNLRVMTNDKY